jgi:hypothetical protein
MFVEGLGRVQGNQRGGNLNPPLVALEERLHQCTTLRKAKMAERFRTVPYGGTTRRANSVRPYGRMRLTKETKKPMICDKAAKEKENKIAKIAI